MPKVLKYFEKVHKLYVRGIFESFSVVQCPKSRRGGLASKRACEFSVNVRYVLDGLRFSPRKARRRERERQPEAGPPAPATEAELA
jgi:hypothetical protein